MSVLYSIRKKIRGRIRDLHSSIVSIKPLLKNNYNDVLREKLWAQRAELSNLHDINIELRELIKNENRRRHER